MNENGVYVFPDAATKAVGSNVDPNLLLALQNNGGNGNWMWIIFLWMMWQNGNFQNFRNNGGSFTDLAAQMNGDTGREFIVQALNGRADALAQIAGITNTGVETVKNGIFALQNAINSVGSQVGMSGLQVQNAIASGNASLSQQLCKCCCDNQLANCQQTNTLQQSIFGAQTALNSALTQNGFAN